MAEMKSSASSSRPILMFEGMASVKMSLSATESVCSAWRTCLSMNRSGVMMK